MVTRFRSPPEILRMNSFPHLGMDGVADAIYSHNDVSKVFAVTVKSAVSVRLVVSGERESRTTQ